MPHDMLADCAGAISDGIATDNAHNALLTSVRVPTVRSERVGDIDMPYGRRFPRLSRWQRFSGNRSHLQMFHAMFVDGDEFGVRSNLSDIDWIVQS